MLPFLHAYTKYMLVLGCPWFPATVPFSWYVNPFDRFILWREGGPRFRCLEWICRTKDITNIYSRELVGPGGWVRKLGTRFVWHWMLYVCVPFWLSLIEKSIGIQMLAILIRRLIISLKTSWLLWSLKPEIQLHMYNGGWNLQDVDWGMLTAMWSKEKLTFWAGLILEMSASPGFPWWFSSQAKMPLPL